MDSSAHLSIGVIAGDLAGGVGLELLHIVVRGAEAFLRQSPPDLLFQGEGGG